LEKTLDWIEQYQVNKNSGEWYQATDERGNLSGSTRMGDDWKAGYHTLRAMLYAGQWTKDYLEKA
jgi:mannose/cellobiose epimerase-like protein (N-acyl-D-glucosamine 2-epimerase family)